MDLAVSIMLLMMTMIMIYRNSPILQNISHFIRFTLKLVLDTYPGFHFALQDIAIHLHVVELQETDDVCVVFILKHTYLEAFSKAITPFNVRCYFIFDYCTNKQCLSIHSHLYYIIYVHILAGFRFATWVLKFIRLFGFSYYKCNKFDLKGVLPLTLDFFGLFLVLFSVSSSLATLVNLGIPEAKPIQISYTIATFVIVTITYIK